MCPHAERLALACCFTVLLLPSFHEHYLFRSIINSTIEMVKPGKFPPGKTEIPFEFPLHVKGNKVLYETYHGVFVNIQVSFPPHALTA